MGLKVGVWVGVWAGVMVEVEGPRERRSFNVMGEYLCVKLKVWFDGEPEVM